MLSDGPSVMAFRLKICNALKTELLNCSRDLFELGSTRGSGALPQDDFNSSDIIRNGIFVIDFDKNTGYNRMFLIFKIIPSSHKIS